MAHSSLPYGGVSGSAPSLFELSRLEEPDPDPVFSRSQFSNGQADSHYSQHQQPLPPPPSSAIKSHSNLLLGPRLGASLGPNADLVRELAETKRKLRVAQDLSEKMTAQARESRLTAAQVKQQSADAVEMSQQLQQQTQRQAHEIAELHSTIARLQQSLADREHTAKTVTLLSQQQAHDLTDCKHRLATLTEEKRSLAEHNARLTSNLQTAQAHTSELENNLHFSHKSLIETQSRQTESHSQALALSNQLSAMQEELSHARSVIENHERQREQHVREFTALHSSHASLQSSHQTAQIHLQQTQSQVETLQAQHETLADQYSADRIKWEESRRQAVALNSSLQIDCKQRLETLEADHAVDIRHHSQRSFELERECSLLKREVADLRLADSNSRAEISRLQDSLQALSAHHEQKVAESALQSRSLEHSLSAQADAHIQAKQSHQSEIEALKAQLTKERHAYKRTLVTLENQVLSAKVDATNVHGALLDVQRGVEAVRAKMSPSTGPQRASDDLQADINKGKVVDMIASLMAEVQEHKDQAQHHEQELRAHKDECARVSRDLEQSQRASASLAAQEATRSSAFALHEHTVSSLQSQLSQALASKQQLQKESLESVGLLQQLRSKVETLEITLQAQEKAYTAKMQAVQAELGDAAKDAERRLRENINQVKVLTSERVALDNRHATMSEELTQCQQQVQFLMRENSNLSTSLDTSRAHEQSLSGVTLEAVQQTSQHYERQLEQNIKLLKSVQKQRSDLQRQLTELKMSNRQSESAQSAQSAHTGHHSVHSASSGTAAFGSGSLGSSGYGSGTLGNSAYKLSKSYSP